MNVMSCGSYALNKWNINKLILNLIFWKETHICISSFHRSCADVLFKIGFTISSSFDDCILGEKCPNLLLRCIKSTVVPQVWQSFGSQLLKYCDCLVSEKDCIKLTVQPIETRFGSFLTPSPRAPYIINIYIYMKNNKILFSSLYNIFRFFPHFSIIIIT